jgi:hypothetical protein
MFSALAFLRNRNLECMSEALGVHIFPHASI